MRLDAVACRDRLASCDHGVLGTVHPERGVDLVPVVYVLDGDAVVIPVDTVKPKTTTRLQRLRDVAADPRCSLLVEHYDADWSSLWWVRASGAASAAEPSARQLDLLAERFPAYRSPGAVVAVLVLEPGELQGWAAGDA